MAEWFKSRAPLAKDDAEDYRRIADETARAAEMPFNNEMVRLRVVAAGKRMAERGGGPVDQEQSLRSGMKLADDIGATGGTPEMANGLKFLAHMYSEPDSRNVYAQAALAPEHMLMHGIEALSGEKPLGERAQRLALAIPASFFPEIGYPLKPSYDRMYDRLGPVGGAVVDTFIMPNWPTGHVSRAASAAGNAVRYGRGAPTYLIDEAGDTIRRLRGSYAP